MNNKEMWTWISPDGKTENQIDFKISNRTYYFLNFTVLKELNLNNSNKLVRDLLYQFNKKKIGQGMTQKT